MNFYTECAPMHTVKVLCMGCWSSGNPEPQHSWGPRLACPSTLAHIPPFHSLQRAHHRLPAPAGGRGPQGRHEHAAAVGQRRLFAARGAGLRPMAARGKSAFPCQYAP